MTPFSGASPPLSGRRGQSNSAKPPVPFSVTPQRTGPTLSSSTTTASCSPSPKRSSARQTAVPTVGWPANGSSRAGVKMRTRAECAGFSAGSTNTVSDRLNSRAIVCMAASSSPSASSTTASGLPANGALGEDVEDADSGGS